MWLGSELLLEMKEHCFEKNELKSSAFSLRSVKKRISQHNEGVRGRFLLFESPFIKDQYALAFFRVPFILYAILL